MHENNLSFIRKKNILEIPFYHVDEIDFEYFLFENFGDQFILFPKFKKFDYWLVVKNTSYVKELENFNQKIQSLNEVNASIEIRDEEIIKQIEEVIFS